MSELNEHLQLTHPYCYSIIHGNCKFFMYEKQKVVEDKHFLINLIINNNIKELDFMELFYIELWNKRESEKDIQSRNYCSSLDNIKEENILTFDEIRRSKRVTPIRGLK